MKKLAFGLIIVALLLSACGEKGTDTAAPEATVVAQEPTATPTVASAELTAVPPLAPPAGIQYVPVFE